MDMMLDLETLGKMPGCACKQIGYAVFDREGEPAIVEADTIFVSLESLMKHGFHVEGSTIEWWLRQDGEAREGMAREGVPVPDALRRLTEAWKTHECKTLWAKGLEFDVGILRAMYEAVDEEPPWRHSATRCLRTMLDLFPVKIEDAPIKHLAEDDAKVQALALQACFIEHMAQHQAFYGHPTCGHADYVRDRHGRVCPACGTTMFDPGD